MTFLRAACAERFGDNGLDVGTDCDGFDPAFRPDSAAVWWVARHIRALLAELMDRHRLRPLPEEWRHFTRRAEPYPETSYDFPIVAPQGAPPATQP